MEEKYPLLLDRFQATFIDTIFVIILMSFFAKIMEPFNHIPDWVNIVLFAGLFFAYEPLCMTFGYTFGNYIKGIRVRKFSDTGKRINIFQAIIRYPVKLGLGWVSFLTINTTPEKRAIHDLISGSVMIKL